MSKTTSTRSSAPSVPAFEVYAPPLDLIGLDPYFAVRGMETDKKHVSDLASRVRDIGALDPVLLWQGPKGLVVLDGVHRLDAYRRARWRQPIPARIAHCDRQAALLLAIEANAKIALGLSNRQRWNVAWRLVREADREGAALYSKSQITKVTGTSKGTVDNMRARLAAFLRTGVKPTGDWIRDRSTGNGGDWEGMGDEEIQMQKDELAAELRRVFNVRGVRNDQLLAEALQLAVGDARLRGWADYLYPDENEADSDELDEDDEPTDF